MIRGTRGVDYRDIELSTAFARMRALRLSHNHPQDVLQLGGAVAILLAR